MSKLVWTPFKEQIFSYLWYLRADMNLAAQITGMPIRKCHTKREQFPDRLPLELRHPVLLDRLAIDILKDITISNFSTSIEQLVQYGLKLPREVHAIWENTYIKSDRTWNETELRTLKWAITYDRDIQDLDIKWRKIADRFFNRTPSQCKQAYETHRKDIDSIINRKSLAWLVKDLKLLEKHVLDNRSSKGEIDWPVIAQLFPNRTMYECQSAYDQYLEHKEDDAVEALMMLRDA